MNAYMWPFDVKGYNRLNLFLKKITSLTSFIELGIGFINLDILQF